MWAQYVFSKRIRKRDENVENTVDGVDILNHELPGDAPSKERVRTRPSQFAHPQAFVIEDQGERFYVARQGYVLDVLGEMHPHAHEYPFAPVKDGHGRWIRGEARKGRAIPFIHGYSHPKRPGALIPDLEELKAMQPGHLEEALRRANAGEEHIVMEAAFTRPRQAGTAWDSIAREFEAGNHPGRMAVFTLEGGLIEWLEPAIAHAADGERAAARAAPQAAAAAAQPSAASVAQAAAQKKMPHFGTIVVSLVAAVAVFGTIALWLRQRRERERDPTRDNTVTR